MCFKDKNVSKKSLCLVFFQYSDIFFDIFITSLIAFLSWQLLSLPHVSIWLIISSLFIHIRRVFILRNSVSGETQGHSWNHVWWWCSQIDWGYTLQPLQHTITISPIWLTAPVLHPPIQSLLTWSLSSPAQTADNKSFQNFCLWSLCCQTMGWYAWTKTVVDVVDKM